MTSVQMDVSKNLDINKHIKQHIRLVYMVYNKLPHSMTRFVEKEDLCSAGRLGLWKAIKTFDASKGSFSTYAVRIIKNEMLIIFRKMNSKRRIQPTKLISIEEPTNNGHGILTIGDTLQDNDYLSYNILLWDIKIFAKKLPEMQKIVLNRLLENSYQEDIAIELGVSQSYVSRLIKKIKEQFKEYYYGKVI